MKALNYTSTITDTRQDGRNVSYAYVPVEFVHERVVSVALEDHLLIA